MNKQQLLEDLLLLDEDKFEKLYIMLKLDDDMKEAVERAHSELNSFYNLYHEHKDSYTTKEQFGDLLIDNFYSIVKAIDALDDIRFSYDGRKYKGELE